MIFGRTHLAYPVYTAHLVHPAHPEYLAHLVYQAYPAYSVYFAEVYKSIGYNRIPLYASVDYFLEKYYN